MEDNALVRIKLPVCLMLDPVHYTALLAGVEKYLAVF